MSQTRQQVIAASEREYRNNPACRRMATAREWVNGALREANHDRLTASEALEIPEQHAEQERNEQEAIADAIRSIGSPSREKVIADSQQEYHENKTICGKMGTVHAWVNGCLREAGLCALTDNEILRIKR